MTNRVREANLKSTVVTCARNDGRPRLETVTRKERHMDLEDIWEVELSGLVDGLAGGWGRKWQS